MNTQLIRSLNGARKRGSILVVCMVMAALGTIGVASWFSLLDARSHQVEANFDAMNRRIVLDNSRLIASQVFYTSLLHAGSGLNSDTTYTIPDGKGSAKISAYSETPMLSTTVGSDSRNGASPAKSYSVDAQVELSDGIGTQKWTYQLRSISPLINGDLVTLFAPAQPNAASPLLMGKWQVKGRIVFWDALLTDPQNSVAGSYQFPKKFGMSSSKITLRDSDGKSVFPLNTAYYPITTGTYIKPGSGVIIPSYSGHREILSKQVNPANSYEARLSSSPIFVLSGATAAAKTSGPSTTPATPDDPALLTFIASSSVSDIVSTLSTKNNLSSAVLMAALAKFGMQYEDLVTILDAQFSPPDDALALMFSKLNEFAISASLDQKICAMLKRIKAEYVSNGRGCVHLVLNNSNINHTRLSNTSWIRLVGQDTAIEKNDAKALSPMVVIMDNRNTPVLSQIHLIDENERPLIFAAIGAPDTPYQSNLTFSGSSPFPVWRIVFDMQNMGLFVMNSTHSNPRTIRGGILANHQLNVNSSGAPVKIIPDPAIQELSPLLTRVAWIETVRNQ